MKPHLEDSHFGTVVLGRHLTVFNLVVLHVLQSMHVAASSAAPAWEDEGLEDIDVDQLVSQHRSRQSPPVVPEASAGPLPSHNNGQQRIVRPAAAAAAAVVKGFAQPVLTPPMMPHQIASQPQGQSAFHTSEAETPQYGSAALDLVGVKERLLEVMDRLLDADLSEVQHDTLEKERIQLKELRAKLEAEPQYGQPPPEATAAPFGAFQSSAQRAPSNSVASVSMSYNSQPAYHQPQPSSWPANTTRQPLPVTNQTALGRSCDVWDSSTAAPPASSSWGPGSDSFGQGGSGSFAYDAPDPAPRDDMSMPLPDPSLRMGSSGDAEVFVTCHQQDGLVDKRWDKRFEWSVEMQNVLERNFGTKSFRANQQQAINASLAGKDVFVLMPTGGGKPQVHRSQIAELTSLHSTTAEFVICWHLLLVVLLTVTFGVFLEVRMQ